MGALVRIVIVDLPFITRLLLLWLLLILLTLRVLSPPLLRLVPLIFILLSLVLPSLQPPWTNIGPATGTNQREYSSTNAHNSAVTQSNLTTRVRATHTTACPPEYGRVFSDTPHKLHRGRHGPMTSRNILHGCHVSSYVLSPPPTHHVLQLALVLHLHRGVLLKLFLPLVLLPLIPLVIPVPQLLVQHLARGRKSISQGRTSRRMSCHI